MCADAVSRVQGGVGALQKLVMKNSAGLPKHMIESRMKLCKHLDTPLAERVVEARNEQIRYAVIVAGL